MMDYSKLSDIELEIEVFKRRGYSVHETEGGYSFHVQAPYSYASDPYPTELEAWEHGIFIELVETGGMPEVGLELLKTFWYQHENAPTSTTPHTIQVYGLKNHIVVCRRDFWRALCEAWLMATDMVTEKA